MLAAGSAAGMEASDRPSAALRTTFDLMGVRLSRELRSVLGEVLRCAGPIIGVFLTLPHRAAMFAATRPYLIQL
jgi:hypothetical protein